MIILTIIAAGVVLGVLYTIAGGIDNE